jgi:hypothetical protein
MTIGYRPSEPRLGIAPATPAPYAPAGYLAPVQWTASQTWAALATCVNNGYLFRTVAGGAGNTSGDGPSQSNLTDASCTWVAVGPLNSLYAQDAAATLPVNTKIAGYSPDFGDGEFVYVKFSGTVAAGDLVQYDTYAGTGVAAPTTQVGGSMYGISMAIQASGTYGWIMLRGVHGAANVVNGVAAGIAGSSGAAAGRIIAGVVTPIASINYLIGAAIRLAPVGALNFGIVEVRYPSLAKGA